jgi:hypothetical protein
LINRYTSHVIPWAKPNHRSTAFSSRSGRITPQQPSARDGTIHSEPESYPHAAIGMGADIVEGFTVPDAMGKAGEV